MNMEQKVIEPAKRLCGEIILPGDKSISHRAIMCGAIAEGFTKVKNVLDCDDCNHTISAFRHMGVSVRKKGNFTIIEGATIRGLRRPAVPLNVGNSGTSMRILSGILAGQNFKSILTGGESLSKRPMMRVIKPLSLMGASIKPSRGGLPPLTIKGGPLNSIKYSMPVPSAQVKSAILFAGLYANGCTQVVESFKSRDHTERMLKYFGADLNVSGVRVSIEGLKGELKARSFTVPADISSASFFLAGAILLKGSRIRINSVSVNPTRAGILNVLRRMGATVKVVNVKNYFEPSGDILACSGRTRGIIIEEAAIPSVIDELPIIFVLAALSEGRTVIKGAGELKVKETDRIVSMKSNLQKMGAAIYIKNNDIVIEGVKCLRGAALKSFGDHRTCMAMTVAALAAKGESEIDDIGCVNKSFPQFFKTLEGKIVC